MLAWLRQPDTAMRAAVVRPRLLHTQRHVEFLGRLYAVSSSSHFEAVRQLRQHNLALEHIVRSRCPDAMAVRIAGDGWRRCAHLIEAF